jgi:uncharacterized protein (DUF488 family)
MFIFTIGFTKTSAQHFFERLKRIDVKKLIDVRLNNISQLAGFAKKDDLAYFARTICGIPYQYIPALAPTKPMLDGYRKGEAGWEAYEKNFLNLMAERRIEELDPAIFDGGCLLCSEDKPHRCHRRLVAEYLQQKWQSVEVVHL